MNRLYKLLLAVALLSTCVACEKNDGAYEINSFSDYSIISSSASTYSSDSYYASTFYLSIGSTLEIMDLSQGSYNHFWEINECAKYLYPNYDSGTTDYTPYIIPDQSSSTTDTKIYLLMDKAGEATIRLYNEFDEYVSYNPAPTNSNSPIYESVYNESTGRWVVDDTFTYYVLDNAGLDLSLYKSGEYLCSVDRYDERTDDDTSTWESITIEAGESITYSVDELYGEPEDLKFSMNGGTVTDNGWAGVEVTYLSVGEYEAGSFTIKRTTSYPNAPASSTTMTIPVMVNVVTPSGDLEVSDSSIEITDENTISITLPINIASYSGAQNYFSITATDKDGAPIYTSVSSVAVKSANKSTLLLTLSEPLYTDDNVYLSYTGGSAGVVTDDYGRSLQNFSQSISYATVLSDPDGFFSFESGESAWSETSGNNFWSISSTMSNGGSRSLHLNVPEAGNLASNPSTYSPDATAPMASFVAGVDYTLSFDLYVVNETGYSLKTLTLGGVTNNVTTANLASYTAAKGVWYRMEFTLTASTTTTEAVQFTINAHNTAIGECYIDNLTIEKGDTRPDAN